MIFILIDSPSRLTYICSGIFMFEQMWDKDDYTSSVIRMICIVFMLIISTMNVIVLSKQSNGGIVRKPAWFTLRSI